MPDQRFLDFDEEFRGYVYLISLALMQFCSLKLLILCFSTSQRSKNHLVYCNLACDFLGPVFYGLGEGFRWYILDFTCLDAIMFAKIAQTLFQHFLGKRKTFGLLKSETSLPRISDL